LESEAQGAFGVVPPECDGCVVSTEFPVFEVVEELVFSEVLDTYFRTPRNLARDFGREHWNQCKETPIEPQGFS
jgi:hypothetical protein